MSPSGDAAAKPMPARLVTTSVPASVPVSIFATVKFWMNAKRDRKSTRLNSSHLVISYAVFCLKKKTFLSHDGVPCNNNNAEHAIKAFASLRRAIEDLSTPTGIEEYLILLSVCQTLKYSALSCS